MASSPKFLPLFFLITSLIFSLQTHARDSQFFTKVTRNRDPTTTTSNTNNALKENEFSTLAMQEDQEKEPNFLPQTSNPGYDHETGLYPPATTSSLYNMDNNGYEKRYNYNNNNNNDDENSYEKNYVPELKGLSEFNYNNDVKNNYYNGNYKKNGNEGRGYYYEGVGYNGGDEKQGMSDTRFFQEKNNYGANYMPNTNNYNNNYGKHFYVPNVEKNYYGANYMPRTNNYNNNYKNNYNGYYGNRRENNYEEFYNNGNAMQGYQSQRPTEEEFDFDP